MLLHWAGLLHICILAGMNIHLRMFSCCYWKYIQSRVTCILTSVLTTFTSFGLAAVLAWFASERWVYTHHHGQQWLADVLVGAKKRFFDLRCIVATKAVLLRSSAPLRRVSTLTGRIFRQTEEDTCDIECTLPVSNSSDPVSPIRPYSVFPLETRTTTTSTISAGGLSGDEPASGVASPPRRGRFATVARLVMLQTAATSGPASPFTPRRRRTTSSTITGGATENSSETNTSDPRMPLRNSRVNVLVSKLKSLQTTQDLAAHQALVRHLQFSPDGKFLATSRYLQRFCIALGCC